MTCFSTTPRRFGSKLKTDDFALFAPYLEKIVGV